MEKYICTTGTNRDEKSFQNSAPPKTVPRERTCSLQEADTALKA